jgi:hypothetical protein
MAPMKPDLSGRAGIPQERGTRSMRMDKHTTKLQLALADAQSIAVGRDHQYVEPAHLLMALIDHGGLMEEDRVQIEIDEAPDANARSLLTAELEEEHGILGASFPEGNPHRLVVLYEHERFSHATLLDTIGEHGFHGRIRGDDRYEA